MQKEIDSEPPPIDPNAPQNPDQMGNQQPMEETPPIDNATDKGSTESQTPELDAAVEKYSKVINMK